MKIKLSKIVIDPTIQVRNVESHTVSKYAASMRAGSIFPPIIIEKKTNRLVCGNHRYFAYKTVFDPDHMVECEAKEYKTEAEIVREAARDNAHHGRPLDTFDRKRIIAKLTEYGDKPEDIASILSIPVEKVIQLAGMTVVVFGKKGKSTYKRTEPVKHGLENLAGTQVTEQQYKEHVDHDRGIPAAHQARQLTRWIVNGWIDKENGNTMEALAELKDALVKFL